MTDLIFGKTSNYSQDDKKLACLGNEEYLTFRQSYEGICIFGGTGSGKTSGSGSTLAKGFLRNGFGGCVLTAKIDERALWERYARETGRERDVVVIDSSPDSPTINLLEHERKQQGKSDSFSLELANILLDATASHSKQGGENEAFWEFSTSQLLRNALVLLTLSETSLSLNNLVRLIRSAPTSTKEILSDKPNDDEPKESLSFFSQVLCELRRQEVNDVWNYDQTQDAEESCRYWLEDFVKMDPKTRSNIVTTLLSQLSSLQASPFYRIFSTKTTIEPKASYEEKKIIIVDFPIKKYGTVGQLAQILFKQIWQRAVERRDPKKGAPVFLWADEAQYFVSPSDLPFLQTARASKASTVFLTQSPVNYRVALADHTRGEGGATDCLLGVFQTQIFHANGCPIANEYAQRVFGCEKTTLQSVSRNNDVGRSDGIPNLTSTLGRQEAYLPILPSRQFSFLKKGGPENEFVVEAYVFQSGRKWKRNSSFLKGEFKQEKTSNADSTNATARVKNNAEGIRIGKSYR